MESKIIEKIKDSKRIRILSECLNKLRGIEYVHHDKYIKVLALDYYAEYEEQFDEDSGEDIVISFDDWVDMAELSIIDYLGAVISEECSSMFFTEHK